MAFPKTKREQQGLLDSRNIVIVILQVVGAIDGVQIEVISPCNDSKVDYFNSKQIYFRSLLESTWFSWTLQQASQEVLMALVSY